MEEYNNGLKVVRELKQIMDTFKQHMENEFKEINLTGTQGMLVRTRAHQGEMKISDLSKRMGLSNSTISGIVDRLERQGIVERIRSEEDRRVVWVNVTSDFRKTAKSHIHKVEEKFALMMNESTPEEIEKIYDGLNLLKNLMEKYLKKKE